MHNRCRRDIYRPTCIPTCTKRKFRPRVHALPQPQPQPSRSQLSDSRFSPLGASPSRLASLCDWDFTIQHSPFTIHHSQFATRCRDPRLQKHKNSINVNVDDETVRVTCHTADTSLTEHRRDRECSSLVDLFGFRLHITSIRRLNIAREQRL